MLDLDEDFTSNTIGLGKVKGTLYQGGIVTRSRAMDINTLIVLTPDKITLNDLQYLLGIMSDEKLDLDYLSRKRTKHIDKSDKSARDKVTRHLKCAFKITSEYKTLVREVVAMNMGITAPEIGSVGTAASVAFVTIGAGGDVVSAGDGEFGSSKFNALIAPTKAKHKKKRKPKREKADDSAASAAPAASALSAESGEAITLASAAPASCCGAGIVTDSTAEQEAVKGQWAIKFKKPEELFSVTLKDLRTGEIRELRDFEDSEEMWSDNTEVRWTSRLSRKKENRLADVLSVE